MSQVTAVPNAEVSNHENPLNDTFDAIRTSPNISDQAASHLNKLHRALQGIDAITRILIANGVQEDNHCGQPLNEYIEGGLLVAANALAEMSVSEIEGLASWQDKYDSSNAEVRHA